MFLADFHIHSRFSDGKLSVAELVDHYGRRGFGAIAITDHLVENRSFIGRFARLIGHTLTPESFPEYLENLRAEGARAWDQYRMLVIPGFELTQNSPNNHRSAHLLALGVSSFISANDDMLVLARKVRSQGALAIAAHPVPTRKIEKQTYLLWDRRRELAGELDAWEVASGPHLFDEVKESRLPMLASSDLHGLSQMTSWKTVLDCERHPEAVLDAIRRQRVDFKFYRDSFPTLFPRPAEKPGIALQEWPAA